MTYVQKTRNVLQNIKKTTKVPNPQKLYNLFKNSFVPFTIIEWNNLDPFGIQKALVFSKVVSLNLLDPPLVVFLIVIIVKVKLDLSHDCA